MRIRRSPLPPKRKRATSKRTRKAKEPPIVKVDDEIEFLWPGWVAPKYILKGTVLKIEADICTDGSYLYTVKWETQKVFPLETAKQFAVQIAPRLPLETPPENRRVLVTVTGRTCTMGKGCIERVQRYK